MLRKTLKVVTTFALLVAGFLAYDQSFDRFAVWLAPAPQTSDLPVLEAIAAEMDPGAGDAPPRITAPTMTPNQRMAVELARLAHGDDHWTTKNDLTIRYYNAEAGYWIYAGDYTRHPDGYRVEFFPFAVITTTKDAQGFKSMTGDRAIVDFVEKFDPFKPATKPARISKAKIEGDVVLRDFKTGGKSDLRIGPLAYLEYEEQAQEIRSLDTPVTIRDRDLLVTCVGVRLDLYPGKSGSPGGFNGVKTIHLLSDVRIVHENIGSSGFLGGSNSPGKGRVPFELTSAGEATIDMPPPQAEPTSGPPRPTPPTIARFARKVVLRRGEPVPDQLDCDDLEVKLYKPEPAATAGRRPADGGGESAMGGDLEIRYARATGHAVWLQSPAQGMRALGNELIYTRLGAAIGDETFFRADHQVHIEKVDVAEAGAPDAGAPRSVTIIDTVDATIHQPPAGPAGGRAMTILAKGPGRLETRPAKDQPPQRIATWQQSLKLKTEADEHRMLTLTGRPMFHDVVQARIDSQDTLVVSMRPRPKAVEAAGPPLVGRDVPFDAPFVVNLPAAPKGSPTGDTQVLWAQAVGDVKLVALAPQTGPVAADATPSRRKMLARKQLDVLFDQPPPPRAVIAGPVAAPAAPTLADPAPAEEPAQVAEAKPPEPDLDVEANTVWARLGPATGGDGSKLDAREVYLRGQVAVHRGPEAGKDVGTDVTGDAVDLIGQTEGRFEMRAHGTTTQPAEVVSDTFRILGPMLTLDQAADTAEVLGPGTLTQWLDSRPVVVADGVAAQPPPLMERDDRQGKKPMTVSWKSGMLFEGRPADPQGRPMAARAKFRSGVDARVDDSRIVGEELDAFFDRRVSLARGPAGKSKKGEPEAKPQLAGVHAKTNVTVMNRKLDPVTGLLLEFQRINGDDVYYDPKGEFDVIGPGVVRLYKRGGPGGLNPLKPAVAGDPPRGNVATVSNKRAADPPLELTRVEFRKQMHGQSEGGVDNKSKDAPKVVHFWEDVQVLHGKVDSEKRDLSPEHAPPEMIQMYSQYLRIDSQGEKSADGKDTSRSRMLAIGDGRTAFARTYGPNAATVEGDKITYNTDTGTFLGIADPGKTVTVAKSNGVGQDPSTTTGRLVNYNLKSGAASIVDASTITFVDANSAKRTTKGAIPDRSPLPDKPPDFMGRQSDRGTKERRGFNSGQ